MRLRHKKIKARGRTVEAMLRLCMRAAMAALRKQAVVVSVDAELFSLKWHPRRLQPATSRRPYRVVKQQPLPVNHSVYRSSAMALRDMGDSPRRFVFITEEGGYSRGSREFLEATRAFTHRIHLNAFYCFEVRSGHLIFIQFNSFVGVMRDLHAPRFCVSFGFSHARPPLEASHIHGASS